MPRPKTEPQPNGLTCEICGKPLTGKQRRACSPTCRNKLRSLAQTDRKQLQAELTKHVVTEAVATEVTAQVGPVVREALTDDIMSHIQRFVHLVPQALDAIEKNLKAEDPDVRQKAATTLLRYTMGNPSVAPPPIEESKAPLKVEFMIPRADTAGPARGGGVRPMELSDETTYEPAGAGPQPHDHVHVLEATAEEMDDFVTCEKRECIECNLEKCDDEFVGMSFRCKDCDARLKSRVLGEFGRIDLG